MITNEHTRPEAAVNHSLGFLGWGVKETAARTEAHSESSLTSLM